MFESGSLEYVILPNILRVFLVYIMRTKSQWRGALIGLRS